MKKLLLLSYFLLAAVAGAQVKVTELPELTGSEAASADVLPIVDVSAGEAGSKKITLAGLFSTPVPWQGVVITGQYGGTGVANTGKTITLGGNLTTSGANALTLTTTGTTNVTLPTSGTLATAADVATKENSITAGTSGQYWRGDKTWQTLDKSAVGLGNVDNTSDASKPVSTAQQTALDAKADKTALTWIDVTKSPYNAAGDAQCRIDGAITSGTATLTSATASFVAGDVGKYIRVEGAGAAGADLITTIATRNSGTSVTLSVNASTTVSSKAIFWGTDDSAAINAAITAATSSTVTRTVYLPPLKFLGNVTLKKNVRLLGAWRGSVIERIFSVSELNDRQMTGTVMFPASTANPVIKGDAVGTVFGSGVEGIVISGSSAMHGIGIQMGYDWGVDGFASSALDITRCHVAGFDTAIKHSNAVQGRISFCSWNVCNTGVELWKHDGIVVTGCDSNEITGNNFRIGSGKNVVIETGNYNNLLRFADITDSTVYVDAVNVEVPNAEVFATRQSVDATRLVVGHVKVLNSTTGILVRNYYAEANKDDCAIDIRSSTGNTVYFDTANSNTPKSMPTSYIRRYASNAFTTLIQTELTRRVYLSLEERKKCGVLEESFASRLAASPYCDLGWTVNQTSGSWSVGGGIPPLTPGGLRVFSTTTTSTNVCRVEAASAQMLPANGSYWELRFKMRNDWASTGIFRAGIWSQDAAVKPQNGLGIRADTSTDTNIQLEIINGGTSTVVDTGVPISGMTSWREVILQRSALGVSCVIKDSAGAVLAPEVFHTATLPTWSGYHRICCYSGSSATQWQDFQLGILSYIQYPNSSF